MEIPERGPSGVLLGPFAVGARPLTENVLPDTHLGNKLQRVVRTPR